MRPKARFTSVQRGFTLLEVLVAIAILGLGLTIVLSAQTGIFWSYSRARHLSQAPGLLRCKMEEIEVELLKLGFPQIEQTDDGPCCEDELIDGYQCDWKIQKVVLPELPLGGATAGDAGASEGFAGGLGAMGSLVQLQQSGGAALGDNPQVSDLTEMMGDTASMSGIAPMVMGIVYPDLKPMLEASIRKVTVSVRWQEGESQRDLTVTQYITSPQQGGLDPTAAEGLDQAAASVLGELTGQTPAAATGASQLKARP